MKIRLTAVNTAGYNEQGKQAMEFLGFTLKQAYWNGDESMPTGFEIANRGVEKEFESLEQLIEWIRLADHDAIISIADKNEIGYAPGGDSCYKAYDVPIQIGDIICSIYNGYNE